MVLRSNDREGTSVSRRGFLKASSVGLGASVGAGRVGAIDSDELTLLFYDEFSEATFGSPGATPEDSWNDAHVDVITLPNSQQPEPFYRALRTGFEQLNDALGDWFSGCKLRFYQLQSTSGDPVVEDLDDEDAFADALDDLPSDTIDEYGLDSTDRLYHFANPLVSEPWNGVSVRRNSVQVWDDTDQRPVSTISIMNAGVNLLDWLPMVQEDGADDSTSDDLNNYKVRSFHHALHMFLDGAGVATAMTGADGSYDAQHKLGTVDERGRRTVMADLSFPTDYVEEKDHENRALEGGVCGSDYRGETSWPNIDDLQFSHCTKTALHVSAIRGAEAHDALPIVDNAGDDFHETAWIQASVEDEDGELASGVEVKLTDVGTDTRRATTGDEGTVVFVEPVESDVCPSKTVSVVDADAFSYMGCVEGGTTDTTTLSLTEEPEETDEEPEPDEPDGDGTDEGDTETDARPDPSVTVVGSSSAEPGSEVTYTAHTSAFRGAVRYNWQEPVGDGNSDFDDSKSTTFQVPEDVEEFEAAVAVTSDRGESDWASIDVTVADVMECAEDGEYSDCEAPDEDDGGTDEGPEPDDGDGPEDPARQKDPEDDEPTDEPDSGTDEETEETGPDPEVTASIDGPRAVEPGEAATFTVDVSNARSRSTYNWQPPVGDGNSNFDDGQSTTHTFSEEGEYTASVAVTTIDGQSAWAETPVTVEDIRECAEDGTYTDCEAPEEGGGSDGTGGGDTGDETPSDDDSDGGSGDGSDGGDDADGGTGDEDGTQDDDDVRDCVENMNYSECEAPDSGDGDSNSGSNGGSFGF